MSEPLAPDVLIQTDELLRKEADDLLHGRGLLQLLEGYGTPHVVGSYSLELMAWRDLDLYLENDRTTETEFFELGGRLASLLRPTNMRFRDTRATPVEGLPPGMYWGVYMDRGIEDAWKIDIWALDSEQSKRLIDFQDDLAKRVTAAARLTILRIFPGPRPRLGLLGQRLEDTVLGWASLYWFVSLTDSAGPAPKYSFCPAHSRFPTAIR